VSPDCHLLPLTKAAFVAPVVGGAAAYHEKHHFFSWGITSSLPLQRFRNGLGRRTREGQLIDTIAG
jgi:hypothetical protein